jgi:hypothetical protein
MLTDKAGKKQINMSANAAASGQRPEMQEQEQTTAQATAGTGEEEIGQTDSHALTTPPQTLLKEPLKK